MGRYGGALQFRVDATAEPPDTHITIDATACWGRVRVRVLRVRVRLRLGNRVMVRLGLGFRCSGHGNL